MLQRVWALVEEREQEQKIRAMQPEGLAKVAEPDPEIHNQRHCRKGAAQNRSALLASNTAARSQVDDGNCQKAPAVTTWRRG